IRGEEPRRRQPVRWGRESVGAEHGDRDRAVATHADNGALDHGVVARELAANRGARSTAEKRPHGAGREPPSRRPRIAVGLGQGKELACVERLRRGPQHRRRVGRWWSFHLGGVRRWFTCRAALLLRHAVQLSPSCHMRSSVSQRPGPTAIPGHGSLARSNCQCRVPSGMPDPVKSESRADGDGTVTAPGNRTMADSTSLKTPLFVWHQSHGGRIVEFGGWLMPVQYSTIADEHQAVRQRVGVFDISHMGRLTFDGPGVLAWLERVTTNHVAKLNLDQIQYSLMANDQ